MRLLAQVRPDVYRRILETDPPNYLKDHISLRSNVSVLLENPCGHHKWVNLKATTRLGTYPGRCRQCPQVVYFKNQEPQLFRFLVFPDPATTPTTYTGSMILKCRQCHKNFPHEGNVKDACVSSKYCPDETCHKIETYASHGVSKPRPHMGDLTSILDHGSMLLKLYVAGAPNHPNKIPAQDVSAYSRQTHMWFQCPKCQTSQNRVVYVVARNLNRNTNPCLFCRTGVKPHKTTGRYAPGRA